MVSLTAASARVPGTTVIRRRCSTRSALERQTGPVSGSRPINTSFRRCEALRRSSTAVPLAKTEIEYEICRRVVKVGTVGSHSTSISPVVRARSWFSRPTGTYSAARFGMPMVLRACSTTWWHSSMPKPAGLPASSRKVKGRESVW